MYDINMHFLCANISGFHTSHTVSKVIQMWYKVTSILSLKKCLHCSNRKTFNIRIVICNDENEHYTHH
jgi:hypothetical protein